MRHVVVAAQRIGQRVHGRHRRVGEGLAREGGAQQHGLARGAVGAVAAGRQQVAAEQAQCLACQRVGQGVLLVAPGVGLDGMDHGVDAGGRRGQARQPEREPGVEQHVVGVELRRDHAHLAGLAGGQDRDIGDFRAGAGGGRHQHQAGGRRARCRCRTARTAAAPRPAAPRPAWPRRAASRRPGPARDRRRRRGWATQACRVASGGSGTTSSNTVTVQPAARRLASIGAVRPCRTRPASVTSSTLRCAWRAASHSPRRAAAPPPHGWTAPSGIQKPASSRWSPLLCSLCCPVVRAARSRRPHGCARRRPGARASVPPARHGIAPAGAALGYAGLRWAMLRYRSADGRAQVLHLRYSSMPYFEPSRPRPDCLTPPKGATSLEIRPVLWPTMP